MIIDNTNVKEGDVFLIEHPFSKNKIYGYITNRGNELVFSAFNMDRQYNFEMGLVVIENIGRISTTPQQDFPEYYI